MTRTIFSLAAGSALLLSTGTALSQDGGRRLTASLTGAEEVPRAGDPDGRGTAQIRVNPGRRQICYTLTVSGIDPARAAHIHEAPRGVAGPIKVNLAAPTNGRSSGCVAVTRELAMEIIRNPDNYYVNVHNQPFPGGAVRGQLSR